MISNQILTVSFYRQLVKIKSDNHCCPQEKDNGNGPWYHIPIMRKLTTSWRDSRMFVSLSGRRHRYDVARRKVWGGGGVHPINRGQDGFENCCEVYRSTRRLFLRWVNCYEDCFNYLPKSLKSIIVGLWP